MTDGPPDIVVVGLGFGDEGKGSVVDYLARRMAEDAAPLAPGVARFNGGPQAAHRVVTADGREHVFAQFGSASFLPASQTVLGAGMLVDPFALEAEADVLLRTGLEGIEERIFADPKCVLVTPYHRLVNRIKELLRGEDRHGSCGMGVGEARFDAAEGRPSLCFGDIRNRGPMRQLLADIQSYKITQCRELLAQAAGPEQKRTLSPKILAEVASEIQTHAAADLNAHIELGLARIALRFPGLGAPDSLDLLGRSQAPVLYEGAQGALLDAERGFFPFVSVTDTGTTGALAMADQSGRRAPSVLGVLRCLPTRHGPGPFVAHDALLTKQLPDAVNAFDRWQREFRVGWFDLVIARYALSFVPTDAIALTGLDLLAGLPELRICTGYAIQEPVPFETAATPPLQPADIFVIDGRLPDGRLRVTDIRADTAPSRVRQEALCRALLTAQPLYESLPSGGSASRFTEYVERSLGLDVVLRSFGPTAADRELSAGFLTCEGRPNTKSPTV